MQAAAACISATASFPALAADAKPHAYAPALLVDEHGDPFKASSLRTLVNYVFHYPFEATPVFLLDLGKPAPPRSLSTKTRDAYAWPGGVGARSGCVSCNLVELVGHAIECRNVFAVGRRLAGPRPSQSGGKLSTELLDQR